MPSPKRAMSHLDPLHAQLDSQGTADSGQTKNLLASSQVQEKSRTTGAKFKPRDTLRYVTTDMTIYSNSTAALATVAPFTNQQPRCQPWKKTQQLLWRGQFCPPKEGLGTSQTPPLTGNGLLREPLLEFQQYAILYK